MKKIILLFLVVVVALGAIYWLVVKDWLVVDRIPDTKPVLLDFSFNEGTREFVAEGQDLSVVEIKAIPTGTNVEEKDHQLLGEMTIAEEVEKQTWVMLVPKSPLSVTEIYAVAYDEQGNKVGKMAWGITGATDIYDAIWKQVPFEEVVLQIGQSKNVGSLGLKLIDVPEDSRCPVDVTCIQAGRITADLEININGRLSLISLKSDEGDRRVGNDYFLNITKVEPQGTEGRVIESGDYEITISVTKEVTN